MAGGLCGGAEVRAEWGLAFEEEFERATEEGEDIARDFLWGGFPAGEGEVLVFVGEDLPDNFSGVGPFVDELIEDAGVAVLRGEAEAEEFEAHAGDVFDERGIIEEPPAAEGVEVAKLASGDAEGVLIFEGEGGDEEFILGEMGGEEFDGGEVGEAESIAGAEEVGVELAADADHHGEGLIEVAAVGEDGVFDELGGWGMGGESEVWGEGDHEVLGVDFFCPIGEEAADFAESLAGEIEVNGIAIGVEDGGSIFPIEEEGIDAESGDEARIALESGGPEGAFGGIEGGIGHADLADIGEGEGLVDELVNGLRGKVLAESGKVAFFDIEPEGIEGGEDASAGFGDRGIFEEESIPDEVCLGGFGELPEILVRDGEVAEAFGDEVMVDEHFVDAPEEKISESGIVEVGMDIVDWGGEDDLVYLVEESGVISHWR